METRNLKKHEMLQLLMRYGPQSVEDMAKINPEMNWKTVARPLFDSGMITSTSAAIGRTGNPIRIYEITDKGREFWINNPAPKVEKLEEKKPAKLYQPYVPETAIYRNDGLKDIPSKGVRC